MPKSIPRRKLAVLPLCHFCDMEQGRGTWRGAGMGQGGDSKYLTQIAEHVIGVNLSFYAIEGHPFKFDSFSLHSY